MTILDNPAPADVPGLACYAALELAAQRPWNDITLRDIAAAGGVDFADLYAATPGKAPLLRKIAAHLDQTALKAGAFDGSLDAHDRLFEAVMARLEAMGPHRAALLSIARSDGLAALAPRLPLTAQALLEAAGIDTGGLRGPGRVAAMTVAWLAILQVWRADEGALNRTMAEVDRQLKTLRKRLNRVGLGY